MGEIDTELCEWMYDGLIDTQPHYNPIVHQEGALVAVLATIRRDLLTRQIPDHEKWDVALKAREELANSLMIERKALTDTLTDREVLINALLIERTQDRRLLWSVLTAMVRYGGRGDTCLNNATAQVRDHLYAAPPEIVREALDRRAAVEAATL
jgi:hypothetical protein